MDGEVNTAEWIGREAGRSLERLLPRVREWFEAQGSLDAAATTSNKTVARGANERATALETSKADQGALVDAAQSNKAATFEIFESRLRGEWPRLFGLLHGLYGGHYDFYYHLEQLL